MIHIIFFIVLWLVVLQLPSFEKRHPPFDRAPTIPLPGLPTAVCRQPEETQGFPVAKNLDSPPAAGADPLGGHRPCGRSVRAVAANLRESDLPVGASPGVQAPTRNPPVPGIPSGA